MLKNFAKSFIIYGFASALSKAFLILLVPLYTNIFSPAEYGIIDLLTGFVALMVIIGMLQMESAIARYYFEVQGEEKKRFISTAFWTIVAFSILFSGVLFFLAEILSFYFLGRNDLEELIIISCPLIILSISFNFLLFLLRYEKKPFLYFVFIVLQVFITIAGILYFIYYNNHGVKGIIYGQMTGIALPLIFLLYYFRHYLMPQWDRVIFIKLLKYAAPLIPSVAIGWANVYLNRYLMLQYLSMTDIGVFSLAVRIASLFSLIEFAFSLSWGPFFWNTFSEKKNYSYYYIVFNFSCLFIFSLVITASFFSEELVLLFSNDKYIAAAPILGIMFLSYSLPIFLQMVSLGAAIVKKTYYIPLIFLAGLLVNAASLFILIKTLNIQGVALAALAGNVFSVAISWIVSEKLFYIGYSKSFFLISFFIAILAVAVCFLNPLNLFLKITLVGIIYTLLGIYTIRSIRKLKNGVV